MKKNLFFAILIGSLLLISNSYSEDSHLRGKFVKNSLMKQLTSQKQIKLVNIENVNPGLICVEIAWNMGEYPVIVDLLFNTDPRVKTEKIMYLVAPAGLNFKSTFLIPRERNIAQYLGKHGYMIIGVTFPENRIPLENAGAFMADWGLKKHRLELEKVVNFMKRFIPLRFDMLGQASSAVCIMDFAAHYQGLLDRIILLDTDSFDPAIQPEKVRYAQISYAAAKQALAEGVYADPFVSELKDLLFAGILYPAMDSGVSREFLNLPGNFTLDGLLHFSLIYTASLPGRLTPKTGLPGEWVMVKGVASGYYTFAIDPLNDNYGLYQTKQDVLIQMANEVNEGTTPIAINKDIFDILSLNNYEYSIPWQGVKEKVTMINGQYSSGEQTYYSTLIKSHGNSHVTIQVIPNYAYMDLLYGENAEYDVWRYFLNKNN